MPEWGALPPEMNSAGFWFGPGAESFMASAMQLIAVAEAIIANLGGHEAVAAGMGVSWPDPTGEMAVLANVPHLMWQALAAGQLNEAAAQIQATAEAFESLKAATPTPAEIGENQSENLFLNASNFLGMLTPAIAVNRTNYGRMWVTAADNKYSYAAASAAGVQSIPPMPPPPPPTTGGGSMPDPTSLANNKQADPLSSGGEGMSTLMSSMGQFASMPEQALSGGPLQSLTSLPQQALSPFQSLLSSMGSGMGNPANALSSASAADWLSATPAAGGSVGANMVGGGGAGGVGSALRGPVGWASAPTVNAAAPGSQDMAAVSRLGRPARRPELPGGGAGMGGTGGMMGPMAHGKEEQDKSEAKRKSPLTSLAELYRAPDGVPVITGSGGAVFRREEVGSSA